MMKIKLVNLFIRNIEGDIIAQYVYVYCRGGERVGVGECEERPAGDVAPIQYRFFINLNPT